MISGQWATDVATAVIINYLIVFNNTTIDLLLTDVINVGR